MRTYGTYNAKKGFCQRIKIKRKPTWEETIYCLTEILGFNLDYLEDLSSDDIYLEEFNERKDEIHETFINFITGDCDWYGLCQNIFCEEDNDDFTLGIFVKLIQYFEEKEII